MIGYKLMRKRKDGSYGSLFINRKVKYALGSWYPASCFPTKGFATRMGWHLLEKPEAPHLSKKGRVWVRCYFLDDDLLQEVKRPASQGGTWLLTKWVLFAREVKGA